MRHFTLASITAAALALGLLASTPSMAQSTQPSAHSDRMAPAGKMAPAKSDAARLDINTATKDELMAFKGIGDKYSDKIIAGRPYAKKDQLVSKHILPEATYKKIAGQIIASQPK
ncbi:MAG TPA: helix-hairpin-helix domain-containing protein [Nitrobacter sp.]|nr:helix-hairpin-helix domain-containing protein [Nitrobacter sp.]